MQYNHMCGFTPGLEKSASRVSSFVRYTEWQTSPQPASLHVVRFDSAFGKVTMKTKRAEELREAWGDAPCEHPQLAKVYDLGAHTGGYACVKCGRAFTFREKAELVANRRTQTSP